MKHYAVLSHILPDSSTLEGVFDTVEAALLIAKKVIVEFLDDEHEVSSFAVSLEEWEGDKSRTIRRWSLLQGHNSGNVTIS